EALNLTRVQKDRLGELMALLRLGHLYWQMMQLDRAFEAFELGLELARTLEGRLLESGFLTGLGEVYLSMGEIELARDTYNQLYTIAQAMGNESGEALANHSLGLVALELGILNDAVQRLENALIQHSHLGELRLLTEAYCELGRAR